jgi:hypothetical protein
MPARSRSEIASAKLQTSVALMRAIEASPDLEPTFQRWWTEAQQVAANKPPAVRLVVFKRTGLLLELMADRAGWAAGRMR